jgi:tetratricopeptide (TPR) repeat protein
VGDPEAIAISLNNLGGILNDLGRHEEAATFLAESVAIARRLAAPEALRLALRNLADVLLAQKDDVAAAATYGESLRLSLPLGNEVGVLNCLEGLAVVAYRRGRMELAARLCGATARHREVSGPPLVTADLARRDALLTQIRRALGAESFLVATAAGRHLTLAEAVAEASQMVTR